MAVETLPDLQYRRFSADEFARMIECGLLPRKGVELIEGIVMDDRASWNGEPPLHRFTRDDYYRMAEVGILKPEERLELIDGTITVMSPIGPYHGRGVDILTRLFMPLSPDRALVSRRPLHLETDQEPEPDLMLLSPRADEYLESHPRPTDVLLLIEVADTTFHMDIGRKLRLYARAGIPEYWLFDRRGRRVLAFSEPVADRYLQQREVAPLNRIAPRAFPDFFIDLTQIFPD